MALVATTLATSTSRARRLAHTALPAGFVSSAATSARVLLVEGATDRVVLAALLIEYPDVAVLEVGGKHLLPLGAAVARAVGARVHVLLDGDGDGWRRQANSARARSTHRRSTSAVLSQLGATPSTVLPDDLETELAQWPSFVQALTHGGGRLRRKDPLAYADAVARAGCADLPPGLAALRDRAVT
ncbi:MAG: TOPRIM nucleotidyl transferase/hydrolase domain-containing protein [Janthinobacterium lividum]